MHRELTIHVRSVTSNLTAVSSSYGMNHFSASPLKNHEHLPRKKCKQHELQSQHKKYAEPQHTGEHDVGVRIPICTLVKHKSWKTMMDMGRDPREGIF